MLVLGIESSCDETAAALVSDGRQVRSSAVASQAERHARFGGVVPELASRAHVESLLPTIERALSGAGADLSDIDAIAVGHRPGLIGALLVGVSAAKAMAWSLGVPLIGVDHIQAHLCSGLLDRPDPAWPALGLVVSGGHTAIYRCERSAEITRLGATIDDAIGEAFDKAASILELGYPGGPEIERWAGRPGARDRAVDLPVSRLGRDSLDFSFSGLKTSLLYAARGVPGRRGDDGAPVKPPTLDDDRRRDLAASFQRAAVEAVTLKLDRAIRRYPDVRTLLTGGGVVANRRLREELRAFADRHGLELVLPELEHCGDNAAMIAGLGGRWLAEGRRDSLELEAHPAATC